MTVKELEKISCGVCCVRIPVVIFENYTDSTIPDSKTYYKYVEFEDGNEYDNEEVTYIDVDLNAELIIATIKNEGTTNIHAKHIQYKSCYLQSYFDPYYLNGFMADIFIANKDIDYFVCLMERPNMANGASILKEIDHLVKSITHERTGKFAFLFYRNSFFNYIYKDHRLEVADAMRKDGWAIDDSFTHVYKIMEV